MRRFSSGKQIGQPHRLFLFNSVAIMLAMLALGWFPSCQSAMAQDGEAKVTAESGVFGNKTPSEAKLREALLRRVRLTEEYGHNHPEVRRADAEVQALATLASADLEKLLKLAQQAVPKTEPDLLWRLQAEYDQFELEAAKFARRIRDPDSEPLSFPPGESTEDRDQRLQSGLRNAVAQAFESRLKLQHAQLDAAEAKINAGRKRLVDRARRSDKIIQRRMSELVRGEGQPMEGGQGVKLPEQVQRPKEAQHDHLVNIAPRSESGAERDEIIAFRIVSNANDHAAEIAAARKVAYSDDSVERARRKIKNDDGEVVARWVPIALETRKRGPGKNGNYRWLPNQQNLVRETGNHLILDLDFQHDDPLESFVIDGRFSQQQFQKWLTAKRISLLEVLVIEPAPEQDVTAEALALVKPGGDPMGGVNIQFELTESGAKKMKSLTQNHAGQQLGIVLDGRVHSAPVIHSTIADKGVISGKFTEAEVKDLVSRLTIRIPREAAAAEAAVKKIDNKDPIKNAGSATSVSDRFDFSDRFAQPARDRDVGVEDGTD